MLASLRQLFGELTDGAAKRDQFGESDCHVAAAALLVHAAVIDGKFSDAERTMLHEMLKARFKLSDADTGELIAEAVAAEREAIDLYQFTSLINRKFDEAARRRIVEMLWQIAYADGRVGEFEDNLIWRAADLLGLSSRQRVDIRRRVAGRLG
jgi:uncharacterized tellurite resistance protein B-like protein